MRDMMATHDRLNTSAPQTRETVSKAAAAAYEAFPAILLAAALLMPALAAIAQRSALSADFERRAIEARTGLSVSIAEQGNQALRQIRTDSKESLRQDIALPTLQ
jgi:hypothetical protein